MRNNSDHRNGGENRPVISFWGPGGALFCWESRCAPPYYGPAGNPELPGYGKTGGETCR